VGDETQTIELLIAKAIPPDAKYRPELYLSRGTRGSRALVTWNGTIEMPTAFRGLEETVWVAFIDLMPEANFEHPVLYAFVIPETGEVEIVDATSPPTDLGSNFQKHDIER
jgi:hypothetical protein